MATKRWLGIGLMALVGQACTLASPTYVTMKESKEPPPEAGAGAAKPNDAPGVGAVCGTDDFVAPDLAKLTACGDGKGHCFERSKAPLADMLTPCASADEVCVPDEILEANGQPLKSCTSIIGPGACVTVGLIPEIERQGGSALQQDTCDPDQRCVPCTDPTNNNAPTPFCQPIGVHENACAGGAPAGGDAGAPPPPPAGCCTKNGKSNGVCIAEAAIPEDQRDKTKIDTCAQGNKCVPAAFVEGRPVKCAGNKLTGPGLCMDRCFDEMMSLAGTIGLLSTEGCGETEVCVPCKALEGQGVPGCD